jgi:tRNA threonylcarbamoyladenosine biosynthesis protein TsaE
VKESKKTLISNSQGQTIEIGKELARGLKPGSLVCLYGQLGAGKTVLAKGIAKGLGVKDEVVSPSYTLLKEYQVPKEEFRLAHFDFYRIDSEPDQPPADLTDYLANQSYICLIEWPERVKEFLPKERLEVYLKYVSKKKRKITIK